MYVAAVLLYELEDGHKCALQLRKLIVFSCEKLKVQKQWLRLT